MILILASLSSFFYMSTQSLYNFLFSIQLQNYYDAFIKAGALDQDLSLLIQFTDNELSEFISALNMLPFHAIKFKKAIRDLNQHSKPVEPSLTNVSELYCLLEAQR